MNASMLLKVGAVSLMVAAAAGCSNTSWPRMGGNSDTSGNQTSYATGSYPMPKTAAATPAKAPANAAEQNEKVVMAAQQALSKSGYEPGAADGKWGEATSSAVMKFQQSHGLTASGDLDASTLSALGVPQL
jgi:hypothetical protein